MDADLSLVARAVWTALILHAEHETGHSWPSVYTLAKNFKVSEERIRVAFVELRKKGKIHSIQTTDSFGRKSFWVHAPKWMHVVNYKLPSPDTCFPACGETGTREKPDAAFTYANKYPSLITNSQSEQNIEGSGRPEPGWKVLSSEEVKRLAEAEGLPEWQTENLLEQLRKTKRIDGRRPTLGFVQGRIDTLLKHKR